MPDEKPKQRRRRKLDDFPERLKREIMRAGLKDAELSRQTGIARNVLSQYQKGTTYPGIGELHALCMALRISANQLVFGDEEPFKVDPLRKQLGLTSSDQALAAAMVYFSMLTMIEKDSVLNIVHALLESRHGREKIEQAGKAVEILADVIGEMATPIAKSIEQSITPKKLKEIEARVLKSQQGAAPKKPKK